jgi:tetratricopeptide (TPR) repeat protein
VDLAEQGKWQEAIGEYDKAIELEPSDPTLLMGAYLMRGRAYDALGDHERAIDDFDTIIEEAAGPPEFLASVYKERGEAYDALGDVQRAIADLEKALSLTNDSSLATQIEQLIEGLAGH